MNLFGHEMVRAFRITDKNNKEYNLHMVEKEITVLLSEKESFNNEIQGIQKSVHQAIFIFFTLCGASASLILNKDIINNNIYISYVLLGLSQIEFFLILFVVVIAMNLGLLSGYLSLLDIRINKLLGKEICLYHNNLVPNFILKKTSYVFILISFLSFVGFIVLVLSFLFVYIVLSSMVYLIIFPIEIIISILSYFSLIRHISKIRDYCNKFV